ncbi:MAG: hypothetical protein LV480_10695 [Methylacidiphilales bacterium]|nr:hypothetical protein [Candidatus Methylacidiphilales bacterium]
MIPVSFDKKQAEELVEDIENDLHRLTRVHTALEKSLQLLEKWDRTDDLYYKFVEAASTELHGLYTGSEKIFERIIIFNKGQKPQGKDFHKSILKTIHEELKLTSDDTTEFLEGLSSLRHLFRHAYGIELNPAEIIDATRQTCLRWPVIRNELEYFLAELKKKISDRDKRVKRGA